MLLNYGVGEDSWESLGLQGDPTRPFYRRSVLGVHWKDWCWSWNSNPLATWCEELTHLKRPWCWERLRAGGEGDDRGWDGWMASLTQWIWVWVNSGSWWWTGRPGVLWFMGSQRVRQDWVNELNWTEDIKAFPAGSVVKNPLAIEELQETLLGLEDPLEEDTATHSSILAWRISLAKEPGGLQSIGLQSWTQPKQLSVHKVPIGKPGLEPKLSVSECVLLTIALNRTETLGWILQGPQVCTVLGPGKN